MLPTVIVPCLRQSAIRCLGVDARSGRGPITTFEEAAKRTTGT
jgi:hypothetical protein